MTRVENDYLRRFNGLRPEQRRQQWADLINQFGYAVPTPEAIEAIRRFAGNDGVCELGAGLGLWARELARAGLTVFAYDQTPVGHPDRRNFYFPRATRSHFNVQEGDHTAIMRHQDCVLMLCYPPHDGLGALMAIHALQRFQGDKHVFIGDHSVCATDEYWDLLSRRWEQEEHIPLPSYPGNQDWLFLYTRKR